MPKIRWRHYAENRVAPLCRQPNGSYVPTDDIFRRECAPQPDSREFQLLLDASQADCRGKLNLFLGEVLRVNAVSGGILVVYAGTGARAAVYPATSVAGAPQLPPARVFAPQVFAIRASAYGVVSQ
jgi:hypothetical protein